MSLFRTLQFIVLHPLNKARTVEALLGYLKWQVGSRLVPGDIVYEWIEGVKFFVRPGEVGLTQNIYCGLQEFSEMAYVLHVLQTDDLFIDIGANVGAYTLLACGVKGARGFCFEPVPETYQRLQANMKLNGLLGRVATYNIGLADKEGELRFTSGLDSTNHVVAEHEHVDEAVAVKVLPLDILLADETPAMVKIDVEGYETLVVNGMLRTLKKPSLHSVVMEMNGSGERYGFDEDLLAAVLQSFGFQRYTYEPFSRALAPAPGSGYGSGNALFVRDLARVRQRVEGAARIRIGATEV